MRRKAALRSSGAPGGARAVKRIGSGFGSCFNRDSLEGVVVMERGEGCGRWLMANAGVVGVETRLFRGERSEASWRLERSVVRKAGACQCRGLFPKSRRSKTGTYSSWIESLGCYRQRP